MKKIYLVKFKEVLNRSKKLPRILAENSFFTFLGSLLVALILGVLAFSQSGILAKDEVVFNEDQTLQFKEKVYQAILDEWGLRDAKFIETESKTYPNPFR